VLMVSADLHSRRTDGEPVNAVVFPEDMLAGQWVPVPGLCATFYVDPVATHTNPSIVVDADFQCFEFGQGDVGTASASLEANANLCAQYSLFIDGARLLYTTRDIFAASHNYMLAWKHHNMSVHHSATLSAGMHSVSVRVNITEVPLVDPQVRPWNQIWTKSRGIVVDVQYL
jgi:hypothetical protein